VRSLFSTFRSDIRRVFDALRRAAAPIGRALRPVGRVARPIGKVLVCALIGVVGAWVAMTVAGPQNVTAGPFHVRLEATLGKGETVIALPPLGSLSADTHSAPLHVTATVTNVDIDTLTGAIRRGGVPLLVSETQTAALKRIEPFALRLFLVAMAGALLLSLVVFRARWRPVAIACLAAFVVVGGSELAAYSTFQPSAFAQPTFSGSLVLAHQLLGPVREATGKLQDFTDELSRVVGGAARVYASIQNQPSSSDEIRVLHISDIHLSPLGMRFAQELARSFDVNFVVDTGDITSFGTPAENLILSYVPGFDVPYVFVRGNHDSMDLQSSIAQLKNVTVLDGTTTTIDGIEIYGLGDPSFTPNKLAAIDDQQIAAQARGVDAQVAQQVAALPTPPDIVAVHDDRMAQSVAGSVPLVISGHFHITRSYIERGTLYLQVGSTGGAGANVYTEEGGVPLEAQILSFAPGSPPRLVAYDDVMQSPVTGSLTVTRHLVTEEAGKLVLTPPPPSTSPSPTTSPFVGVSPSRSP